MENSSINKDRDPQRMRKTLRQAETAAFTTQFFYFTMNVLFCFILYKYKSLLNQNYIYILLYGILLTVNAFFIVSTGNNPGYQLQNQNMDLQRVQKQSEGLIQQQCNSRNNSNNYCDICKCRKKMRTKHCFRCGKCVRKFDHHCPWIGACVGQNNHFKFCFMMLMQTVQAIASFIICFYSLQMYEYKDGDDYFGQQFGVFLIFSLFMFLYILFVGGLFFFHAYLILLNLTTTEVTSRGKAAYLKGIKGNPFNKGIITNLMYSINVPKQGHEWHIDYNVANHHNPSWYFKIFSNQYYQCC